jgi:Asp-tRNA(Asn)/Glu-tRNA(Gln) amidotransferase A subunit family amidase
VTTEDAHLLRLLANAGAVFHVRTNQPQSLMVGIIETIHTAWFY